MCESVAVLESTVHVCNKYIICENIIYDYYLYMHMHCGLQCPPTKQWRFSQALFHSLLSVFYVTFMLDNQGFVFPARIFVCSQWRDGTNSEISLRRNKYNAWPLYKNAISINDFKALSRWYILRGEKSIWGHFPVLRIGLQIML